MSSVHHNARISDRGSWCNKCSLDANLTEDQASRWKSRCTDGIAADCTKIFCGVKRKWYCYLSPWTMRQCMRVEILRRLSIYCTCLWTLVPMEADLSNVILATGRIMRTGKLEWMVLLQNSTTSPRFLSDLWELLTLYRLQQKAKRKPKKHTSGLHAEFTALILPYIKDSKLSKLCDQRLTCDLNGSRIQKA